jgi:hypothetical protein
MLCVVTSGVVLRSARPSCHLGKNIRQATRIPQTGVLSAKSATRRPLAPQKHDVGGEYAVYMMAGGLPDARETGFSGAFWATKP